MYLCPWITVTMRPRARGAEVPRNPRVTYTLRDLLILPFTKVLDGIAK